MSHPITISRSPSTLQILAIGLTLYQVIGEILEYVSSLKKHKVRPEQKYSENYFDS